MLWPARTRIPATNSEITLMRVSKLNANNLNISSP